MEDSFSLNTFKLPYLGLMIKYKDLSDKLTEIRYDIPGDKINLFINMETLFRRMTAIDGLDTKVYTENDLDVQLVSYTLMLAGHYKKFFRDVGVKANIYLYNTDIYSDKFNESKYNEDFRTYYKQKYTGNPKFVTLMEILFKKVIPEIKIISDFIPGVYYIMANNIEGSLVPKIIGSNDKSTKNLIITTEIMDTEYFFGDNCTCFIFRKHPDKSMSIYDDIEGYLKYMTNNKISDINLGLYNDTYSREGMYSTLLSVKGDKYHSIDKIDGFSIYSLQRALKDNILRNIITADVTNPELIGSIFTDEVDREDFINNYYCTNLSYMYEALTDTQKQSIFDQIVDKSDINSLYKLNSTRFFDYPLNLETLL